MSGQAAGSQKNLLRTRAAYFLGTDCLKFGLLKP